MNTMTATGTAATQRAYLMSKSTVRIGVEEASCVFNHTEVRVRLVSGGISASWAKVGEHGVWSPAISRAGLERAVESWGDVSPAADPTAYLYHAAAMLVDKLDEDNAKRAEEVAAREQQAAEMAEREQEHDGWYAAVSFGGMYDGPRGPWKSVSAAMDGVGRYANRKGSEWGTIARASSVRIQGPFATRREAQSKANISSNHRVAFAY